VKHVITENGPETNPISPGFAPRIVAHNNRLMTTGDTDIQGIRSPAGLFTRIGLASRWLPGVTVTALGWT
jgi:hypothetical protein